MQRQLLYFHDNGSIPNSQYPVVIYRNAFPVRNDKGAEWLERHFARNGWGNSWRSGIFTYHHYHSTAHEVLGIYGGNTRLELGGAMGRKIEVTAGDIIVLPAGVGHKNLGRETDVQVMGAYDNGRRYDILCGEESDRPAAIDNIREVPLPGADPLTGTGSGLCRLWK